MSGHLEALLRGPKAYALARKALEVMERHNIWPTALNFELWLHYVAAKDTPLVSRDSEKKIERLEKLTRKIRGDAGGDDQEIELPNRPSDMPTAMCRLAEAAETLSKDVRNTPRQVVSASVIEHANVLLELIKIVRSMSQ